MVTWVTGQLRYIQSAVIYVHVENVLHFFQRTTPSYCKSRTEKPFNYTTTFDLL